VNLPGLGRRSLADSYEHGEEFSGSRATEVVT
jgi:hypothetical protein